MKKITLCFLLLLSMLSFGQSVSVTVTELKVLNLPATTINFGTNVSSVNVSITVNISTSYINNSQGSVAVYYNRNSSTAAGGTIPTNGYDGNFFLANGTSGTKTFKITLNRADFDNTGGSVYVQYCPYVHNLLAYQSSIINVTKLSDPISNNIISQNQTIYAGQSASTISGSTPSGGDSVFNYSWQQKIQNGSWTNISGANSINYLPGILNATTSYRRIVSSAANTVTSNSNEVTITVIPTPVIENNTITLNNLIVEGSIPTGGLGANSYLYSWYIIDEDGDTYQLPDTSTNLALTTPQFTGYLNSTHNFILKRLVTSGNQILASNGITLPHSTPIQNNTISVNGNIVTGSIPTGGLGNYTYSWAIYYSGDPVEFPENTKDLDLTSHLSQINLILQIDSSAKLVRIVTAGISSTSNQLALNGFASKMLKKENTLTASIYPNPTSESVNFTTNYSSDKEIEIVIYSETVKNTQSIYKGIVTPNQTVKWNIPANYPKGIYYYKLISDNTEIKSGKIIYQ